MSMKAKISGEYRTAASWIMFPIWLIIVITTVVLLSPWADQLQIAYAYVWQDQIEFLKSLMDF